VLGLDAFAPHDELIAALAEYGSRRPIVEAATALVRRWRELGYPPGELLDALAAAVEERER